MSIFQIYLLITVASNLFFTYFYTKANASSKEGEMLSDIAVIILSLITASLWPIIAIAFPYYLIRTLAAGRSK